MRYATLVAVALLVAALAVYAGQPVNPDKPIQMTAGMYADLLCLAASDFSPGTGGIQFTYEPDTDTIRSTLLPATRLGNEGKYAAANAEVRKTAIKERADFKLKFLLPQLKKHVSTSVTAKLDGF